MKNFYQKTLVILSFIMGSILIANPSANAESIPVLTWERAQTQNVVLGNGLGNLPWDLILRSQNGNQYSFERSFANRKNFYVYSIDLSSDFPLGGYVVEARNQSGQTKDVAGVQVLDPSIKVITRVPLELFLILIGLSIFLLLINMLRDVDSMLPKIRESGFKPERWTHRVQARLDRFYESQLKESLLKYLIREEARFESIYFGWVLFLGLIAFTLIGVSQYIYGSWVAVPSWILVATVILSNFSISVGLLSSFIGLFLLLTNIAQAKNLSEILSIIVICSILVFPNLYNHLLMKFMSTRNSLSKLQVFSRSIFTGLLSSLVMVQLLLLYESLGNRYVVNPALKLWLFLVAFILFNFKNLEISRRVEYSDLFEVIRSIGPLGSVTVSIFSALVIYSWTTNLIVSMTAFLSLIGILTLNWLKTEKKAKMQIPKISFIFGISSIITAFIAIYLASRVLPLDVVNRSHIAILLIFPIDLFFAIYIAISNRSEVSTKLS